MEKEARTDGTIGLLCAGGQVGDIKDGQGRGYQEREREWYRRSLIPAVCSVVLFRQLFLVSLPYVSLESPAASPVAERPSPRRLC